MDRQTLTALVLGNAETKVEHKTEAATAHVPARKVDTCTIAPRTRASSWLSVTVITQPGGVDPVKPMCNDRVEGKIGMAFCSAVLQRNLVNVSLLSQATTFAAMNAALRASITSSMRRYRSPIRIS
jgi:hypothetical protein